MLTDASQANKSGIKLEEDLESFLKKEGRTYKRQKSGTSQIDFIIPTKGNSCIFADCTNQTRGGSVEDKIIQKARKYWRKYDYKDVYIIRGKHKINKEVLLSLKEDEKAFGYTTHIMTFDEFKGFLLEQEPYSPLEKFFI